MFPQFSVADASAESAAVLGRVSSEFCGTERWVVDGGWGYLFMAPRLIPGRWQRLDVWWLFTPADVEHVHLIRGQHAWLVLDGYWGERAELVLDSSAEWVLTRFAASDAVLLSDGNGTRLTPAMGSGPGILVERGWDHEHCVICWQTIGMHGCAEAYCCSPRIWVCPRCHDEFVAPRSLGFVQNL